MAAKAVKKGKTEKKSKAPKEVDPNMVTLSDLIAKSKMSGQAARQKLRAAEVKRPEGRWAWKKGSKDLETVKKALGL